MSKQVCTGKVTFAPKEMMKLAFEQIDASDGVVVEFSEKGTGLGIEAGYAFAKNKPVFVIAHEGADISDTLKGIAREVIFYKNPEELNLTGTQLAEDVPVAHLAAS